MSILQHLDNLGERKLTIRVIELEVCEAMCRFSHSPNLHLALCKPSWKWWCALTFFQLGAHLIGLIRIRRTHPAHPKCLRMSSDELDTRLREDVKDFTTPSSGSQLNDRTTQPVSSG